MRALVFVAILFLSTSVSAQDSLRSGIKYGVLPIFSFNTDNGLYLGGELNRYDYGGILPFNSFTRINTSYQTNGAFSLGISRDEVRTFGTDIRTSMDVFSSQNFGDYFFGDTDELGFDKQRFDSTSYYSFKSFRVNIGGATRFPLSFGDGIERLDIKTGLRIVYETPWGTPQERFINEQNIVGSEGAFLTIVDLAVVLERRNAEFRAQRGYIVDVGLKYAPPIISTHHTILNYINTSGFLPLIKKIPVTLAGRFSFQNTIGDTPYWFTPTVGGAGTMRGYIYRRFSSDNAISYSMELRSWLFKIPYKNIELGANFFADGGRVFSNENWGNALNSHKLTLGFGGVMSIFTPDYILKYDIGFSDEGVGIYLGTGYSF